MAFDPPGKMLFITWFREQDKGGASKGASPVRQYHKVILAKRFC